MRLKDKIALITGAGSGIGKETAVLFAREGAKIAVVDINKINGEDTLATVKKVSEGVSIQANICDRAQVSNMVDEVVHRFGRIDILINNAGITQDSLIAKMTEKQWDGVIDTNLKGAFNCTQFVAEKMLKQQSGGVIINASSIVGLYGNIGQCNYAAAKAGLIGMTKALAKELGRKGIRVNALAPGFIATPMTANIPEKILESMKEKTPLGRLGEPKDVANAYLFLASDEAKFINGAILSVDGGLVT